MNTIDAHDITLMATLLADGIKAAEVAEKFEITIKDVLAAVYPDLPAPGLYVKRLNRGQAITGEFGIEKRCPKCTDFHPATAEFWHHCHKNTDGFHWWCKACECERKPRAKRATNQTTHREISL